MHVIIVFVLALLLSFGGCGLMFCGLWQKKCKQRLVLAWISFAILVIGIVCFSFMNHAIKNTEVSNVVEQVYPIDKLTTGQVLFTRDDDQIGMSLSESYVKVKQAEDDQVNIVVKITETKNVDWLIDFEFETYRYDVILDSNVYARYLNNNILFERSNANEN
jgi:Flp pilus assembly protein CpaB